MVHVILEEPSGDGWTVRSEQISSEMTVRSGHQAEEAAKHLGAKLAEAGDPAEVPIHLRDGSLAGRFICTPTSPSQSPNVHRSGAVSNAQELAS